MSDCIQHDPALDVSFEALSESVRSPSGNWSDFNNDYRKYEGILRMARFKLFNINCLPPEPDPADYSDLD
jgi:hypothetical protein